MANKLCDNRYELDEVYAKPTEWATSYHHPDCGHAEEPNSTKTEAENNGYKPADCCLRGINTNRVRLALTNEAHKKLYESTRDDEDIDAKASRIIINTLDENAEITESNPVTDDSVGLLEVIITKLNHKYGLNI